MSSRTETRQNIKTERRKIMKKTYKLKDLDCANCAAKMECAINKLEGVDATVNFMTQKITITAPDDRFDEMVKQAAKICKRIEPDCEILV